MMVFLLLLAVAVADQIPNTLYKPRLGKIEVGPTDRHEGAKRAPESLILPA